jgi:hypothetical protein
MIQFKILQAIDDGSALLVEGLADEDASALTMVGYHVIHTFDAESTTAAQEIFIAWCKTRQPDANVFKSTQAEIESYALKHLHIKVKRGAS